MHSDITSQTADIELIEKTMAFGKNDNESAPFGSGMNLMSEFAMASNGADETLANSDPTQDFDTSQQVAFQNTFS